MTDDEHDDVQTDVQDDLTDITAEERSRVGWIGIVRPSFTVFVILLLIGGVLYDLLGEDRGYLEILGYEIALLSWMYWLALLLIAVQVGLGMAKNPGLVRHYWDRFSRSKIALFAGGVATLLFAIGTFGPLFIEFQYANVSHRYQPPPSFTIEYWEVPNCVGEIHGDYCHGSWEYPLGTDGSGRDLIFYTVYGLQTSFQVGLTATVLSVIIGTAFGMSAAYYGGWTDAILMRIVDLMHAIPAFFIYALIAAIFMGAEGDLVIMTLVFGTLSWGGIARLVRSEVLQKTEEDYVKVSVASGASAGFIIRRHLLPNTSNTIITSASMLVPTFMLFEAALSYLDLGHGEILEVSLGSEIAYGLEHQFLTMWQVWWIWLIPAVVLVILLISVSVAGDAIRDATDPRLN